MKTIISDFGSSKGVIIPSRLLKESSLNVNDIVDARVENGCIVIQKFSKVDYSIIELLALCEPNEMTLNEEDRAWLNS